MIQPNQHHTDAVKLTSREAQILQLIARGCSNKQIAAALFISIETVKTHIKNMYRKLEVGDRIGALNKTLRAYKQQAPSTEMQWHAIAS